MYHIFRKIWFRLGKIINKEIITYNHNIEQQL